MRNRKPIPQKIKTVLQKEIGSVCPFCQSKDVDHFEFHHIDEHPENNQITNLLMLCPTCHSKITKDDISYEEVIKTKRRVSGELKPKLTKEVEELLTKGKVSRNEGKLNEAASIYTEALALSEKLNDHFAIAKCKLALASILNDKYEFPCEALKYIKESEEYFRDNNLDDNIADALYEASIAELATEEFDNARMHLLEAVEINKRQNDKYGEAECYHQMGWLEHGQGHLDKSKEFYRKAIEICEQEYTKQDKKLISSRIGACYTHIALVNKAEGNISEAESHLTKGLDYFRQSELPISIGQTLFFLAELKLKTQQLGIGQKYLQEALQIFYEIKEFRWLAEALDLLSLLHYNFGDKQKGIEIFHAAIKAIEETNDTKNKLKYYRKLAELYKIEKKYEEAENLYLQVIDLSDKENIDDEYFRAIMGIVMLKKIQDKPKERNEFARKGIDRLKQVLINTQREFKKAETLGDIAALYTESENYIEAKKYLLISKDAFINLANKNGIAQCIGALAYIYHLEGDYKKEGETNKELKELTEGTYNYFAQASAAFNLCVYEIENKKFDLAKKYFDEAEYLNYSYDLDLYEKLDELEYGLNKAKDSYSTPEFGIKELIYDLYELLKYYPEEAEDLLRFWLYYNGNELFSNFRLLDGLKFLVVTNNTNHFLKWADLFYPYSELFIQSFYDGFEQGETTYFHYPHERLIPKGVSFLAVPADQEMPKDVSNVKFTISKLSKEEYFKERANKSSIIRRRSAKLGPYTLFFVDDKDIKHPNHKSKWEYEFKKHGIKLKPYKGNIILGFPMHFPKQFESLLLKSAADEILRKKIFFDLNDRGDYKDRFFSDLTMSDQLGFIPVYEYRLPKSERVIITEHTTINIPIFVSSDCVKYDAQIRSIKNLILKFSLKVKTENIQSKNLKLDIEEYSYFSNNDNTKLELYITQFETYNKLEKQVALVYQPENK